MASVEPRSNQFVAALQIDDSERKIHLEQATIFFFQRGTGEDYVLPFLVLAQKFLMDGLEPGDAIFVREGNACVHLLFVGWRMKIVGLEEEPAEAVGQKLGDGGLAGTGDAHDQEDHQRRMAQRRCLDSSMDRSKTNI